ncbi:MAG: ArsC family transcriptional regulator, partial [Moorea sp. SIO4G2]|nr:ArsC family transcriptional regulator [Moorena sp. SIO4G2]
DWQLDDPDGQPLETFRRVRDEIKERVAKLVETLS